MKKQVNHKTFYMGTGNAQVAYSLRDGGESHTMTNEKRVLLHRIELMADGQLSPVSNELKKYNIGKREYICHEPEMIDTFQGWKKRGFYVKRGQKAITFLKLYAGYGWKEYHFFSQSQVARA